MISKVCKECRCTFEYEPAHTGRPRLNCSARCRGRWAQERRNDKQRGWYNALRKLGLLPAQARWACKTSARFKAALSG